MGRKTIPFSERKYLVYRATSPSGKFYIGLTHKTLEQRKSEHQTLAKSGKKIRPFQNALMKYDFKFTWEILAQNLSLFEAEEFEKGWIAAHNSTNSNFGYNLSPGGSAGSIMSEEGKRRHKEKMDIFYKDKNNIEKMRQRALKQMEKDPEKFKKDRSNATKAYFSNKENYNKHYLHMRRILTDRNLTIKRSKSMGGKPFICNETGERFDLLKDAANKFGVDKRQIHRVLKYPHRYKTILRKYTFSYIGE